MHPRIALVTSSYHPHLGGVETHVRQVASELRTLGVTVEVWTVDRGERLRTTRLDGIVVRHLPTPLPARSPLALALFAVRSPSALGAWAKAQWAFRPEVLHVQCFGPNGVYAAALARLTKTPLVVSTHGETFADDHDIFSTSILMRRALARTLAVADATTGCSEQVLDDLRARFDLRGGVVVSNGIGPAPASSVGPSGPPPAADGQWAPTVFAVGRLEKTKGFDLLLRAFARMREPAGLRLVLAGSGSQRRALDDLASELGLTPKVHLVGPLDEAAVDAWMRRSDLVVMPSRREAFGIVALEAWRSGTPLVATSLGGPASFVRHDVDGLLVDPTDLNALAAAMTRVLTDREMSRRLSANGRERFESFTWTQTAQRYLGIYGDVMHSDPR